MDIWILTAILGALIVLFCVYSFVKKPDQKTEDDANGEDSDSENDVTPGGDNADEPKPKKKSLILAREKIGTKKRAKLELKAEKKLLREQEQRKRDEERKLKEEADEKERLALEQERVEESKRLEVFRKKLEEKQKQDHEQYLKIKESFVIEEEGCYDVAADANLLDKFIDFIKKTKIVVLEELAVEFKLRTQDVIKRIADLQNDNVLAGVIDDRGKFIYIESHEWEAVADFIERKGRLSIADLTEYSAELIKIENVDEDAAAEIDFDC